MDETIPSTAPVPHDTAPISPVPQPEQERSGRTFSRDDMNRMITAEVNKALEKERSRHAEAERLAKMSADEREQHERESTLQRAEAAEAELNAYKLQAEATKLAGAQGLPLEFLDTIDFHTAKAENVKPTVSGLASAFKAAVETEVNERLKQKLPRTISAQADTQRQMLEKIVADKTRPNWHSGWRPWSIRSPPRENKSWGQESRGRGTLSCLFSCGAWALQKRKKMWWKIFITVCWPPR